MKWKGFWELDRPRLTQEEIRKDGISGNNNKRTEESPGRDSFTGGSTQHLEKN